MRPNKCALEKACLAKKTPAPAKDASGYSKSILPEHSQLPVGKLIGLDLRISSRNLSRASQPMKRLVRYDPDDGFVQVLHNRLAVHPRPVPAGSRIANVLAVLGIE